MIDHAKIFQKADALLALPLVSGKFPVPIERIVEYLQYECRLFTPDAKTIDVSGVVNHREKKIFINASDPPQRQLFTLAHEVGHIVLHGDQEDYIDYRNNVSNAKETEANTFAANLIMPASIFRYMWQETDKDIKKMSRFFGASFAAIAIRLEALKLE